MSPLCSEPIRRTKVQKEWGDWRYVLSLFSRVWPFATPWTVACQVPLSMDSPGHNTGVGCHFLLQGIFPTQGSNPGLLHYRQILYHLSYLGSPAAAAAAAKSLQSCLTLCDPIDGSLLGSPSLGFSRQERWSGLPFPSPMQESEKWKWTCSVVSDS